jgi:hypothetical protein
VDTNINNKTSNVGNKLAILEPSTWAAEDKIQKQKQQQQPLTPNATPERKSNYKESKVTQGTKKSKAAPGVAVFSSSDESAQKASLSISSGSLSSSAFSVELPEVILRPQTEATIGGAGTSVGGRFGQESTDKEAKLRRRRTMTDSTMLMREQIWNTVAKVTGVVSGNGGNGNHAGGSSVVANLQQQEKDRNWSRSVDVSRFSKDLGVRPDVGSEVLGRSKSGGGTLRRAKSLSDRWKGLVGDLKSGGGASGASGGEDIPEVPEIPELFRKRKNDDLAKKGGGDIDVGQQQKEVKGAASVQQQSKQDVLQSPQKSSSGATAAVGAGSLRRKRSFKFEFKRPKTPNGLFGEKELPVTSTTQSLLESAATSKTAAPAAETNSISSSSSSLHGPGTPINTTTTMSESGNSGAVPSSPRQQHLSQPWKFVLPFSGFAAGNSGTTTTTNNNNNNTNTFGIVNPQSGLIGGGSRPPSPMLNSLMGANFNFEGGNMGGLGWGVRKENDRDVNAEERAALGNRRSPSPRMWFPPKIVRESGIEVNAGGAGGAGGNAGNNKFGGVGIGGLRWRRPTATGGMQHQVRGGGEDPFLEKMSAQIMDNDTNSNPNSDVGSREGRVGSLNGSDVGSENGSSASGGGGNGAKLGRRSSGFFEGLKKLQRQLSKSGLRKSEDGGINVGGNENGGEGSSVRDVCENRSPSAAAGTSSLKRRFSLNLRRNNPQNHNAETQDFSDRRSMDHFTATAKSGFLKSSKSMDLPRLSMDSSWFSMNPVSHNVRPVPSMPKSSNSKQQQPTTSNRASVDFSSKQASSALASSAQPTSTTSVRKTSLKRPSKAPPQGMLSHGETVVAYGPRKSKSVDFASVGEALATPFQPSRDEKVKGSGNGAFVIKGMVGARPYEILMFDSDEEYVPPVPPLPEEVRKLVGKSLVPNSNASAVASLEFSDQQGYGNGPGGVLRRKSQVFGRPVNASASVGGSSSSNSTSSLTSKPPSQATKNTTVTSIAQRPLTPPSTSRPSTPPLNAATATSTTAITTTTTAAILTPTNLAMMPPKPATSLSSPRVSIDTFRSSTPSLSSNNNNNGWSTPPHSRPLKSVQVSARRSLDSSRVYNNDQQGKAGADNEVGAGGALPLSPVLPLEVLDEEATRRVGGGV